MRAPQGNGGGGNGDGGGGAVSGHDPFDLLEFPCRFEIKAMGRHNSRFDALVHNIVSRHIAGDDLLHSQHRPSRHGNYVSVTCIIRASSKAQIRAIYADLAECPDVLMTL